MTQDCWLNQKARLIDRFGKQNFSPEFSLLVSVECKSMPDAPFVDMVNAMIGNRKPSNPPLLQDFRDGRLSFEKRKFEAEVNGAIRGFEKLTAKPIAELLSPHFGKVGSVSEAFEIAKLRLKTGGTT